MRRITSLKVLPANLKILVVNTEKAIEGANLRVITLVLNPTKVVEGVEIPDRDRHRDLWYHMGRYHGSHVHDLHFNPQSVEDLAGQKLVEEIE